MSLNLAGVYILFTFQKKKLKLFSGQTLQNLKTLKRWKYFDDTHYVLLSTLISLDVSYHLDNIRGN